MFARHTLGRCRRNAFSGAVALVLVLLLSACSVFAPAGSTDNSAPAVADTPDDLSPPGAKAPPTTDTANAGSDEATRPIGDAAAMTQSTAMTAGDVVQRPYGPRALPSGVSGVRVSPGDDLQDIIDANPSGTAFVLAKGIYRGVAVRPKDGNAFIGEEGAVLNGSRRLTSFTKTADSWKATAGTTGARDSGTCDEGDACNELFLDDQRLRRVRRLADLRADAWYFDRGADTVHLGTDPSGHAVELSVLPYAFFADFSADRVTVRNLVIEKYAAPGSAGAINAVGGEDWTIHNNDVRMNQTAGIRLGDSNGTLVTGNTVHHNTQYGMTSYNADGAVVEFNALSYNNVGRFDPNWDAGSTKFVASDNLVLRHNYVHDNFGSGLWVDIDNTDTLFEGNVVVDNDAHGIFFEISYRAVIRNNTVERNGQYGIYISGAPDVNVYDNQVLDNAKRAIIGFYDPARGSGIEGPYELRNLNVHHNLVTMPHGYTGIEVRSTDSTEVWTSWNNRFHHNTYRLTDDEHYTWENRTLTATEWRSVGNDRDGTYALID